MAGSTSASVMENVCIPMFIDAFALSLDCCDGKKGQARIAPITQPNYTSLRLDSHLIQHDLLDHIDFHNTAPASKNPRVADIGLDPQNNIKLNRLGVHLHWSIPRYYRTAVASGSTAGRSSGSSTTPTNSSATGQDAPPVDQSNPVFPPIPNRWLVTRHLKTSKPTNVLNDWQSWIIESDRIRLITQITDDQVDLETDTSPFVSYSGVSTEDSVLKSQSEVFIGQKFDLNSWKEDGDRPKSNLTIMNSSNPLFGDAATHNTNVLSTIDDFKYSGGHLTEALCDYSIIGWHADTENDPLTKKQRGLNGKMESIDLASRLSKMMLKLSKDSSTLSSLLDDTSSLCFASIFDVQYNQKKMLGTSVADAAALKFTSKIPMEPLSLGTTPLDGILTFLEAHKKDADDIFGEGASTLAGELLQLSQLLYANVDGYDARVQAQDLIAQQNYAKADGGSQWTFAKQATTGNAPVTPSDDDVKNLRILNEAQSRYDIACRKMKTVQWDLFAQWWRYVSEFVEPLDLPAKQKIYKDVVQVLKEKIIGNTQIPGLTAEILKWKSTIDDQQGKVICKISAKPAFYTRTDPTLCIAGLDSGRPKDFLDTLQVLTESELAKDVALATNIIKDQSSSPFPPNLKTTAMRLLAQCYINSGTDNGKLKTKDGHTILASTTGIQSWGGQNPFVPLFIEWEAAYYHISRDKWSLELRPSPVGHKHSQVRYAPNVDLIDDKDSKLDVRTASGRVLILPQPTFSFENVVLSVLDIADPLMQLKDGQVKDIRDNIKQMRFISAPLSGLRNHLLTRCEGSHVKPNVRKPGHGLLPLQVAWKASKDINIDSATLDIIGAETALTPYGRLVDFASSDPVPFKSVTHGQVILTKVNIVDKFGQAVCLPTPKPRLRDSTVASNSNIFPCFSDYLSPSVFNGHLNTVYETKEPQTPGSWPLCQFAQLTHSINQDARVNAAFLIRDEDKNHNLFAWREALDHEQPIWGWIIINYADGGLQFFLADGTFYCEVRMGGVSATNLSAKWLPYGTPPTPVNTSTTWQLDQLIRMFIDGQGPTGNDKTWKGDVYLQNFFTMINGGIQSMPFPPSDYSGFANAIVGKPLALVNAGWSLEMSTPALTAQNSAGKVPQDSQKELESYQFPLKIGDADRNYDGVVGYYLSSNNGDPSPTVDWTKLYTYFPTSNSDNNKNIIDIRTSTSQYIPLSPFYLNPEASQTQDMTKSMASKYTVTTLLIDPYTSLHGYSPILPTKSLKLPLWTIQSAFNKMHAFFRLGPTLSVSDVPQTYAAATPAKRTDTNPPPVKLPVAGHKGTWTWLQPYSEVFDTTTSTTTNTGAGGAGGSTTTTTTATTKPKTTQFAELPVLQDDATDRFPTAPYTFLEGYLQLMGKLGATAETTTAGGTGGGGNK